MMKCGLLGRKLGHSYSPQIHSFLGTYAYNLYEKEPEELESFLKHSDFSGINVTIPYKKDVIPYLDILTPRAAALGAVNTIVRQADGTLLGHNTDYYGFLSMVQKSGADVTGKKVLVLGSGGASNTAAAVLRELGAEVVIISRSGENNYANLSIHADASLIVNTTPVGMFPNTGVSPVDLEQFHHLEGVLDVIYNPARTQLLLDAENRRIPCMNGLWMLVAQAKEAAEYFTGEKIDDSRISQIHHILKTQMENIVLIGMPGSGKTTVGKLLSSDLMRRFVDSDAEIERAAGKTIPEIFAEDGEEVFRSWETQILSELGRQSGLIIATGGGCVTRPHNYPLLHQNGCLFWLQRELNQLPKDGRPLSLKNDMSEMYAVRKPMYQTFCDHIIDNNGPAGNSARKITVILEENS